MLPTGMFPPRQGKFPDAKASWFGTRRTHPSSMTYGVFFAIVPRPCLISPSAVVFCFQGVKTKHNSVWTNGAWTRHYSEQAAIRYGGQVRVPCSKPGCLRLKQPSLAGRKQHGMGPLVWLSGLHCPWRHARLVPSPSCPQTRLVLLPSPVFQPAMFPPRQGPFLVEESSWLGTRSIRLALMTLGGLLTIVPCPSFGYQQRCYVLFSAARKQYTITLG